MNWKRIRKDAGEITIEDLREYPSWEFCLDEEGVEGQTECTIRPFKKSDSKLSLKDYCLVAADLIANNGTRLFGWVTLGDGHADHAWDLSPEILLPSVADDVQKNEHCNNLPFIVMTCPGTARISLCLGASKRFSDEKIRPKIELAYRALKMSASEVFPLTIEPRQFVEQWPKKMIIEGFLRPSDEGPGLTLK